MIFPQKNNSPNYPLLSFNGSTVCKVHLHKHLGLNLDSKLSFVSHINEKINEAKKKCTKYSFVPILTIVMSFITLPHLTNLFESSITLNALMERVEKNQYQEALVITGTCKVLVETNYMMKFGNVYLIGGVGTLDTFFKFETITPPYLKEISPVYGAYCLEISNTDRYMKSLFPNSTRSWNNIGINFQSSPSLGTFKKICSALFQ